MPSGTIRADRRCDSKGGSAVSSHSPRTAGTCGRSRSLTDRRLPRAVAGPDAPLPRCVVTEHRWDARTPTGADAAFLSVFHLVTSTAPRALLLGCGLALLGARPARAPHARPPSPPVWS